MGSWISQQKKHVGAHWQHNENVKELSDKQEKHKLLNQRVIYLREKAKMSLEAAWEYKDRKEDLKRLEDRITRLKELIKKFEDDNLGRG